MAEQLAYELVSFCNQPTSSNKNKLEEFLKSFLNELDLYEATPTNCYEFDSTPEALCLYAQFSKYDLKSAYTGISPVTASHAWSWAQQYYSILNKAISGRLAKNSEITIYRHKGFQSIRLYSYRLNTNITLNLILKEGSIAFEIVENQCLRKSTESTAQYSYEIGPIRFLATLQRLWLRSSRDTNLLYFDLDNTRLMNDYYGLSETDAAIYQLGQVISKNSKTEKCIYCRIGGDEYLIIFFGNNRDAFEFSESVRGQYQSMNILVDDSRRSTTSSVIADLYLENVSEIWKQIEKLRILSRQMKQIDRNKSHIVELNA